MDVRLEFRLRNLEPMVKRMLATNKEVLSIVAEALHDEANNIMTESRNQVPVDTGTLKSSAYVLDPQIQTDEVRVRFGYGGPNDKMNPKHRRMASEYAAIVHERLDVRHPVGKAKYLEDPFNDAIRGMEDRVASKLRSELGW